MFPTASVARAQPGLALDFHLLHEAEQGWIAEPPWSKLPLGDFSIRKGDGDDVGEAVVGGLAALRPPFRRVAPDDLHRGVVALNDDGFDLLHIPLFCCLSRARPQSRSGCDTWPEEFDACLQNHRRIAAIARQSREARLRVSRNPSRPRRSALGRSFLPSERCSEDPPACRMGYGACFPVRKLARARLPQRPGGDTGDVHSVRCFFHVQPHQSCPCECG